MIEKMKVVHIVAAQTQKTELLDALRALGIVHFAEKADADQTYLERFAALSRLITVLEEQGVSEVEAETLDDVKFKQLYDGLNACLERKKALEAAVFGEHRDPAVQTVDDLQPLGFDLLKLRRHLHHDRLELLLFQLQRRQIALKLLEPILLDLQFIFC